MLAACCLVLVHYLSLNMFHPLSAFVMVGFVMVVQADRVQALHAKPLPSVAGLARLEGKIVTVGVQGAVLLPGQEKSR